MVTLKTAIIYFKSVQLQKYIVTVVTGKIILLVSSAILIEIIAIVSC